MMEQLKVAEDHEFIIGQMYRDARTEEPLALVYLDESAYILRDEQANLRFGPRKELEREVSSGRYYPDSEHEGFDGIGGIYRLMKAAEQYREKGGRKNNHFADAMTEAVSILTDDVELVEPERIDFESLDGIGEKGAKELRLAGFETDVDVRRADDSELLDVPWIGEKGVESIRQYLNG